MGKTALTTKPLRSDNAQVVATSGILALCQRHGEPHRQYHCESRPSNHTRVG